MGLVAKAVPADQLEEEVEREAKAIALMPRDGLAVSKATWHLVYNLMGMATSANLGALSHTLFTNVRWEPDEYNLIKNRRDKGITQALHGMHDRFSGLASVPERRGEKS